MFGSYYETIMVSAYYPEKSASDLSVILKDAVLSTSLNLQMGLPLDDGMWFTIDEKLGMKLNIKIGGVYYFTLQDSILGSRTKSNLTVSRIWSLVPVKDREKFSEQFSLFTEGVESLEKKHVIPVSINNLEGFEITQTIQQNDIKERIKLYQIILFDNRVTYIILGSTTEKGEEVLNIFRKFVRSFKKISTSNPMLSQYL